MPMNSSPFLLPSEIMITFSDEWSDRCQCNSSRNLDQSAEWSKSRCDTSHRRWPEHQQQLDHFATRQTSSRSSMNVHRSFDDLRDDSSVDVPDLSHTPGSCDSSVSGSASLSFDSSVGNHFAYYAPDLDALGSLEFNVSMSNHPPPDFSLPSFPSLDSTDNESTIHSPKPIFGYNTFEFDFDRPQSRDAPVATSPHKRDRDAESGFEEILLPLKRRKLSDEAPAIFSLYPTPYRDVSLEWSSCSSVVPSTYPDDNVFSMEHLLNCTIDWTNDAWPKLPVC